MFPIYMYSQTCLEQSLMGNVKSDLLKEVQSKRTKFFMDVNEHKLCGIMYMVYMYAFFSGIKCINVLNVQILFIK
jgi:hypothetical protein